MKLICVFVFAYAKSRFSHDEAHLEGLSLPNISGISDRPFIEALSLNFGGAKLEGLWCHTSRCQVSHKIVGDQSDLTIAVYWDVKQQNS